MLWICPLRLICGMTATGNTLKCAGRSFLILSQNSTSVDCFDLIIYVIMDQGHCIGRYAGCWVWALGPLLVNVFSTVDHSASQSTATPVLVQLASWAPNGCNIVVSADSCNLFFFFTLPFTDCMEGCFRYYWVKF